MADAEHDDDEGEDGRDGAPGLPLGPGGQPVDEHRDEGGRQHAPEDDVEEHVGGGVGQVVGVGQAVEAEHVGEDEDPADAGEARRRRCRPPCRRSPRRRPAAAVSPGRRGARLVAVSSRLARVPRCPGSGGPLCRADPAARCGPTRRARTSTASAVSTMPDDRRGGRAHGQPAARDDEHAVGRGERELEREVTGGPGPDLDTGGVRRVVDVHRSGRTLGELELAAGEGERRPERGSGR